MAKGVLGAAPELDVVWLDRRLSLPPNAGIDAADAVVSEASYPVPSPLRRETSPPRPVCSFSLMPRHVVPSCGVLRHGGPPKGAGHPVMGNWCAPQGPGCRWSSSAAVDGVGHYSPVEASGIPGKATGVYCLYQFVRLLSQCKR